MLAEKTQAFSLCIQHLCKHYLRKKLEIWKKSCQLLDPLAMDCMVQPMVLQLEPQVYCVCARASKKFSLRHKAEECPQFKEEFSKDRMWYATIFCQWSIIQILHITPSPSVCVPRELLSSSGSCFHLLQPLRSSKAVNTGKHKRQWGNRKPSFAHWQRYFRWRERQGAVSERVTSFDLSASRVSVTCKTLKVL